MREVLAWFAFLAWVTFVVSYTVRAKWWRSPEGRNVWFVAVSLAFAFGVIVAAYTWPEYPWRPVLVPAIYGALGVLGVQRTWQMFRRQRRRKGDA